MKKVILFDLDGTLLDTLSDLHSAMNHVLESHGYPIRTIDEVRRFVGNGVGLLVKRACPSELSEEQLALCLAEFKEWYGTHSMEQTCLYPGIDELLKHLHEAGYKLGTVSNKFESAVQELCHVMMPGMMDICVGDKEGYARKPNPANVHRAISSLGSYSPEEVLYVGDSETDVETAQNAGLDLIAVTWGFRDAAVLRAAGAEHLASNTTEFLNLLNDFNHEF